MQPNNYFLIHIGKHKDVLWNDLRFVSVGYVSIPCEKAVFAINLLQYCRSNVNRRYFYLVIPYKRF